MNIDELTQSDRDIVNWITDFLVAGTPGGVRQVLFAGLHQATAPGAPAAGIDLLDPQDEVAQARLIFNTLDSYGDNESVLSDFTGEKDDLTSWDILEADMMPDKWDRGPKSPLFKLCIELRTQAVLRHCSMEDGSYSVDVAKWNEALKTAFEPLKTSILKRDRDKEVAAKNKLIKARREQLEKYAKPDKKAALKQFAVNHELNDAKQLLRNQLPILASLFDKPLLERVWADRQSGAWPPPAAAAAAPAAAAPSPAEPVAQSRPSRRAARPSSAAAAAAEEPLEEEEDLGDDDDGAAAAAAPPKRRKAGGQSARKPAGRKPAASSSPAAARPRRAAGASAASASGSLSLAEIKEGSGLDHEEFLQVWQQKHPQVQRWLRAGQGSDEDEDEDDESQQDALSDASNRPQQVRTTQPRPAIVKS